MKLLRTLTAAALFIGASLAQEQTGPTTPRTINLHEAVEMAPNHNHIRPRRLRLRSTRAAGSSEWQIQLPTRDSERNAAAFAEAKPIPV